MDEWIAYTVGVGGFWLEYTRIPMQRVIVAS